MMDVAVQAGWGNEGAVLMRWRVGPASGMWDVHINISHNVHASRFSTDLFCSRMPNGPHNC
jgi:hypothetical protein